MPHKKLTPLVLALAATVALAGSCGNQRGDCATNVLLIVVDTLRADHLGCYGYQAVRTPHVDGLASGGARFTTVVTPAPITSSAVASLVTGTFPNFHGVRDNELFSLNEELPSVATAFREAGYATAGFAASAVLDRRYGFAQGFDLYDDHMTAEFQTFDLTYAAQKDELRGTQRRAVDVTGAALEWLRDRGKEKPFFCMVHYFDPHDPYDPPPPFGDRYSGAPYDGEIAYTDAHIGILIEGLRDAGLIESTLIVLAADHGEGLGEHGERTHGFFLYDSTILVPLIFYLPGVVPSGVTFNSQVRTVDVMPTILDLAEIPIPETVQGVSLAPALRGETGLSDMDAYVETFHTLYSYNWHELQGIRTGRFKYLRAPEAELYDLVADPAELTNLAEQRAQVALVLEASLSNLEDSTGTGSESFSSSRSKRDAKMLDKMRALGYLGGSSRDAEDLPRPGGDLPDPKAKIADLNARQEAGGHLRVAAALMLMGDFKAALEKVEDARRVAPDYAEVTATEGLILVRSGKLDEGIALLEQAIERDPRAQMVHQTLNNLGLAYLQKGQCDLAVETLKRSLREKEDYHNATYNLGLAYERCGRPDEAVRSYETFLEENPKLDPAFLRSVRLQIENLSSP